MAKKNVNLRIGWDLKAFSDSSQNLSRELTKVGKQMKSVGKSMSTYLTAPIAGLAALSVINFDKQAKSVAQVEAGLKSTGGSVGFVSKELQKMAGDLQKNTLFGDEEILQGVTAQLLTFTNITGVQFEKTQKAALDLATRLDGDLKGASIMLGKALNDPVANLSALSRAGIQFSTEQKALVKSLVEGGKAAEAQDLILAELEKQYGGSAEAAAAAGSGPFKQMSMALGDLSEGFGEIISEYLAPFALRIKEIAENLQTSLSPAAKKIIVLVAALVAGIGPLIFIIGSLTVAFAALTAAQISTTLIITGIIVAIGLLVAAFLYVRDNLQAFKDFFYNAWVGIANGFIDILKSMVTPFLKFANILGLDIGTGINAFLDSFKLKTKKSTAQFGSFKDTLQDVKKDLTGTTKEIDKTTESVKKLGKEAAKPIKLGIDFSAGIAAANLQKPAIESITEGLKSKGLKFDQPIKAPVQIDIKPIELPKELFDQQAAAAAKRQAADLGEEMGSALSDGLKSLATEGLTQFGDFLGTVISGGDMTVKDFGRGLLDSLGKFMSQFGEAMVAMGIAQIMLDVALKSFNPALAIIGGVALIAAGAAISNLSQKGIDKSGGMDSSFSGGGNFSSMSGIGANMQPIVLDTRLSGRDMIITQGRESQFKR
jgi:hypothetical protein